MSAVQMMTIIVSKSALTTMVAILVIVLLAINWTVTNITAQVYKYVMYKL